MHPKRQSGIDRKLRMMVSFHLKLLYLFSEPMESAFAVIACVARELSAREHKFGSREATNGESCDNKRRKSRVNLYKNESKCNKTFSLRILSSFPFFAKEI